MAELNFEISVEYAKFQKAMQSATKELKTIEKLGKKMDVTAGGVERLDKAHIKLDRAMEMVNKEAKSTSRALKFLDNQKLKDVKVTKQQITANKQLASSQTKVGVASKAGINSAKKQGLAFTQLAYAMDDVQYGFRGVQNNLQQVAVMAGLGGPAILGITAALIGLNYLLKDVKLSDLTGDLKDFNKELKKLESVKVIEGFGSITKELIDLEAAAQIGGSNFDEWVNRFRDIPGILDPAISKMQQFELIAKRLLDISYIQSLTDASIQVVTDARADINKTIDSFGIIGADTNAAELGRRVRVEGTAAVADDIYNQIDRDNLSPALQKEINRRIYGASGADVTEEVLREKVDQLFAPGGALGESADLKALAVERTVDLSRVTGKTNDTDLVTGTGDSSDVRKVNQLLSHRLRIMRLQGATQIQLNATERASLQNSLGLISSEDERLAITQRIQEIDVAQPYLEAQAAIDGLNTEMEFVVAGMQLQGRSQSDILQYQLDINRRKQDEARLQTDINRLKREELGLQVQYNNAVKTEGRQQVTNNKSIYGFIDALKKDQLDKDLAKMASPLLPGNIPANLLPEGQRYDADGKPLLTRSRGADKLLRDYAQRRQSDSLNTTFKQDQIQTLHDRFDVDLRALGGDIEWWTDAATEAFNLLQQNDLASLENLFQSAFEIDPQKAKMLSDYIQGIKTLNSELKDIQKNSIAEGLSGQGEIMSALTSDNSIELAIDQFDLLGSSIERAFTAIGSGEGIRSALAGVMGLIGEVLVLQGKALIAKATVEDFFKLSVPLATALPIGLGAIALGSFIKGSFGGGRGSGSGGSFGGSRGGGGGSTGFANASPQGFNRPSFNANTGLELRISGEDLRVVRSVNTDNSASYIP